MLSWNKKLEKYEEDLNVMTEVISKLTILSKTTLSIITINIISIVYARNRKRNVIWSWPSGQMVGCQVFF